VLKVGLMSHVQEHFSFICSVMTQSEQQLHYLEHSVNRRVGMNTIILKK